MEQPSRKAHQQLIDFFEYSAAHCPDHVALICNKTRLTYQALNEKANQLAHYLLSESVMPMSIVGILLDRSVESYISILAILKIGATYVPIETEHPDERINLILADLDFHTILTSTTQKARTGIHFPHSIELDDVAPAISKKSIVRPDIILPNQPEDQVCYIIYTSGSTGKPKGVEVTHRNICHYVNVASTIYAIKPEDKVYQGFSLAFDASLEELWMAFANAATLVACTKKDTRIGVGLVAFLNHHEVTVFSTVPTLLATLEGPIPSLRLLILGGEAATDHLVERWMRPGLRIINTYGPTETTVIATYAECHPHMPVTIGKPLPGYEVLILDEQLQEVIPGEEGELCIGGNGLARGYVNRPETTAAKFIINPHNPAQRLYRTGDRGFLADDGNIQFTGRVDDQVKLRGFRIELNEIEAIITSFLAVHEAVVVLQTMEEPTLVAYLLVDKHIHFDWIAFKAYLTARLPAHMIPRFFEQVDAFPLLSSGKVDRKALPKPTQQLVSHDYVAPESALETLITEIWEEVFRYSPISVTADFFMDLGGHSLLAARVISQLRKHPAMKSISILDLYQAATIRELAQKGQAHVSREAPQKSSLPPVKSLVPTWKYYACGIGQFFGCVFQYAIHAWQFLLVIFCYNWIAATEPLLSWTSFKLFTGLFLAMPLATCALTIIAKWTLLGRVQPGQYPVWGWYYWRWWLVQRLEKNIFPVKYLTGSPLVNFYYRMLGVKIGKNCYIDTANMAACDVISIGDNTSIGCDARIRSYVIEDGWLKIGRVSIGQNCFIGSRSLLDIDTVMEDYAALEDMSMLPRHSVIPRHQFYAGSPACLSPVPTDHIIKQVRAVPASHITGAAFYGMLHYFALVFTGMIYCIAYIPGILLMCHFYDRSDYIGAMLLGVPLGTTVFLGLYYLILIASKKLILGKIQPGHYPVKSLYFLRQWTIVKMLDIDEISVLADSLYFPLFLRCLGAKIGKHVEMGEAPHILPDLVHIKECGFTASSVGICWPSIYQGMACFASVTIGEKSFVGNMSLVQSGSVLGDHALLGCMSIQPANKMIESNSDWFGSPPVFLPKRELLTGFSDQQTTHPSMKLYGLRLLIESIRIILPTMCSFMFLLNMFYVIDYLLDNVAMDTTLCVLPFAEFGLNIALVGLLIGLKWLMLGRIEPVVKPVWDIFIWKNDIREYTYSYFINQHLTNIILGTPFIAYLFRAMGAKVGKRFICDSAEFAEFDLMTIGDDVCINAECLIQTHLYEDRIFKLSRLLIKDGCNLGAASMVLYDTVMNENASLGSLSVLMKGEDLPKNTYWQGVPAQACPYSTDVNQEEAFSSSAASALDTDAEELLNS